MTESGPNAELGNDSLVKSVVEADMDQDTCRICSAPAEPDQPLFHPCKCSGTIRYIHQDCLTTWLSHSKKKTCDVCKHPYLFTKVYADDMPRHLPVILLLRKFAQQVAFAILFCLRAIIVSFVWLAILPWVTVWTWRMYFAMGNSTAWWISARPRSSSSSSPSFFLYNLTSRSQINSTSTNTTLRHSSNDTEFPTLNALLAHPLLRSVSADIFTGQIIATLIVLVFIAVFLLREWISQNARPGVFEEGDPAIAVEREAEQERERQQQLLREQARAAMEQRDIQLRRWQQVEAERLFRVREGDTHQLESSRRNPDQPIRDLPLRPPSRRAHELRDTYVPQTAQLDQVAFSSSDAAGPSGAITATVKDDQNMSYSQARQEWLQAAEKRRHFAVASTSSSAEWRGSNSQEKNAEPSVKAQRFDNARNGKGKAKAIDPHGPTNQGSPSVSVVHNASSVLAVLKQKRVAWGVPDAESWTLYEFERFEMTRFSIDLMFSPCGVVAETDPLQLIQAEVDPSVAQDGPMSLTSMGLHTRSMIVPDDWTEWLGYADDDAWRWRARRRVLWERLREEAKQDGLGPLQLPRELSSISIEDLYTTQDLSGVWTPPPAPRLISRVPVLTALPSTPSSSDATDDGSSLLSSHKRLRAEGPRTGRSFTISTVSVASPDENDGSSRLVRLQMQPQADTRPFSSPSIGRNGDSQLLSYTPQRSLPFPIVPSSTLSQEPPSQPTGSTPSHRGVSSSSSSYPSPTLLPFDSQLPPTPAISMPRRPPMPNMTIPTPTSGPSSFLRTSGDSTPLASPSLATYQPPEEFQEGSARQGYFDDVVEREGELDRGMEKMSSESFERDAALYFKEEPIVSQNSEKESRSNAEEEDEDDEDEGDLPGLLADSDEDGEEDARELRGAARRGERRAGWGPEWGDAGRADVVEEEEIVAEADDDGEDAEGEEVDDAALAAQLADEDMAVEDDMEGALEAIGMRGPLYVVAQNAALMIFVLDTAVGLGVWLPFTFGKSTALLSLDPRRALQVLHWPIRVIRIVTDPVVDSIFLIIGYLILPFIARMLEGCSTVAFWALSKVVPGDALQKSARFIDNAKESITNFPWDTATGYIVSLTSTLAAEPSNSPEPSIIIRLLKSKHPVVVATETYLEALGKQAKTRSYQVATGWTQMALGDGTGERVFSIALGYAVIGLLVAFYLNVFTVGSVRSAGRAVRSAVRQQLLVVKVATFIIIELVLFPLGCGINLDLCSIWLFPEASLQSRIAFFQYAPLTAIFYHWVVGTMFMYQFAILLAGCRTIMRPGAMWFIKDPSDQNFHPIRDILERPALVQLRKLSVSAIMYGLVVACGVGCIGGLMRLGRGIVLPLRWKPREPLSDVPIDLLFLHILLPYTLRFFRPRRVIRTTSITIWKYLCTRLRLTSYMFGGRHPEEERELPHTRWLVFGNSGSKAADGMEYFLGSYRRVPNSDNVAVPRDMRATARVDVNGLPVDDEARGLIAAQDAEAEKAKRNPKDDYTVVYIPPHFQYRIGLFIFALWVIGCIFVTAALSTPILLGRAVFNLFTQRQMHDGYSFLVGFYALWGCWVVGHAVERMDKRRQRRSADDARGNWPLYFLKRSALWLAKISYIVLFVGIAIPALIGLVVDLYIIMPIRLSLNPDLVPNVRVVDTWALGIIYAKMALHANRLRPLNRITAGFNHIKAHGWTNPEPFSATAEVIAPLIVGLVGMLALPPAIVVLLRRVIPVHVDQRFILVHVYPGIFASAGLMRLGVTGSGVLSRWSQSIRDTEFLVEMRLRNYEQDKESEKNVGEKGRVRDDLDPVNGVEEAPATNQ